MTQQHFRDPAFDARAYQEYLLGALGDDDPADAQSHTPAHLRALIRDAGERLSARPADGEWSVLECVAHIADAELVMAGRYRWVLAQEQPHLIGYDQDAWVARLRHVEDEPAELLGPFEALRAANVALWRRTSATDRARIGLHAERGPESYELMFRMIAGHDRVHLDQARRALAALGSA